MSGSTRYVRYLVFAAVALILLFFISSSSSVPGAGHIQSATELLKNQGWKQSSTNSADPNASSQDANNNAASNKDTVSGSAQDGTSPNPSIGGTPGLPSAKTPHERVNATFVTLARNSDVWSISSSIRQVEDRFNRNYNYDWVFLNDGEFDEKFKKVTTALTSGRARYGKIGTEHWGYPDYIDTDKAAAVREEMGRKKIIYGDSESYRHMCRYESGFFFQHPLMLEYEWYWRVEPSIELYCDIDYDPFAFMAANNKMYGFTMSLLEYVLTIPTLWSSVKTFMKKYPEHISEDNSMYFISEDNGESYNLCHFWSNFEIGSLTWLRSKAYTDYFNHLDRDGGFFYERWGDAPVHSIAAALMLKKDQIHFFNDIAYYHVPFTHCPTGEDLRMKLKCNCEPEKNFDWNDYSCTKRFFEMNQMALPEGYENET